MLNQARSVRALTSFPWLFLFSSVVLFSVSLGLFLLFFGLFRLVGTFACRLPADLTQALLQLLDVLANCLGLVLRGRHRSCRRPASSGGHRTWASLSGPPSRTTRLRHGWHQMWTFSSGPTIENKQGKADFLSIFPEG